MSSNALPDALADVRRAIMSMPDRERRLLALAASEHRSGPYSAWWNAVSALCVVAEQHASKVIDSVEPVGVVVGVERP